MNHYILNSFRKWYDSNALITWCPNYEDKSLSAKTLVG